MSFLFVTKAYAVAGTTVWDKCLSAAGSVTISCVIPVFTNVINAALVFAGVTAVIMLIIAGIKLILSGGEAKQAAAARQIITYTLVGLVLILLSFTVVNFISYLTNVGCIKTFGFENCQ